METEAGLRGCSWVTQFSLAAAPASRSGSSRGDGLHLPECTAHSNCRGPGPSLNANERRGRCWRLRAGALVAHFPPRGEGGARQSGRGWCYERCRCCCCHSGSGDCLGERGARLRLEVVAARRGERWPPVRSKAQGAGLHRAACPLSGRCWWGPAGEWGVLPEGLGPFPPRWVGWRVGVAGAAAAPPRRGWRAARKGAGKGLRGSGAGAGGRR